MAIFSTLHTAYACGILGNIVSFLVYLAPVPTFYRIFKRKSTEGFQAIPYSVALFSAMLYLYYAFLKKNVIILISINSIGCVMEISFLTIYIIYATKESRVFTTKLILVFNVSILGFIIAGTYFVAHGHQRVKTVGWICAAFSVSVFAAPLTIMRQVIRTKSVEFMPLPLSIFLAVCAVVWFFYGFLIHDYYIAAPNILGFVFGVIQMTLYFIYRNQKQQVLPGEPNKIHDITSTVIMEVKENSENASSKRELEIVVRDYSPDEVPEIVVVQSKELV